MALINHQISMRLETAARKAFRLNGRGGLYGVIDADYIDRVGHAFTVLVAAVSPYYKDGSVEDKAKIDSFLEVIQTHLKKITRQVYKKQLKNCVN
ncbi:hypothetical protein P5611_004995 [Bacillus subtilis]